MKRGKVLLLLLLPAISLFFLPKPSLAAIGGTATFEVTKDTYANLAYPDKVNGNFGSVTLSNKNTTRLGYLWFQDIDLPEGAVINEATLKIYVHEQHYADHAKLNVGPVTGDWEESALTWNHKPTINQTLAFEAEISLATTDWQEITVTDLARQWYEGNLENKGLFLYPLGYLYGTPETEFALSFKSKEAGALAAQLVVDYVLVPTPTTEPSPTPTLTPEDELVEPTATPAEESDAALTPTETKEEVISPTPPEESPTPSSEVKGQAFLALSPAQTVLGGLAVVALVGAVVAFALYFRRTSKKEVKKKTKKDPSKSSE